MVTPDQIQAYEREGFVLVDGMFSPAEIEALLEHVGQSPRVNRHAHSMPDSGGRASKLALWMDVGEDIFGAMTANPRLVHSARALLGEDVYHWHSKITFKEPGSGGAWEWHQDYGYWYHDGCLYPRLLSCMVALDAANRQNGCLKVLVGSHRLGRLEHGRRGGQAGADPERVAALERRLSVRYIEASPGSVLFFHCNTLHASEANLSDRPRRAFICCYNLFSNVPYGTKGHGKPEPINVVADDALVKFACRGTEAR